MQIGYSCLQDRLHSTELDEYSIQHKYSMCMIEVVLVNYNLTAFLCNVADPIGLACFTGFSI